MTYLRLPLRFDPDRLRRDLDGIRDDEWVPHFNTSNYEGDWSGVALRAVDGDAGRIYPDPTALGRYADTPVLARCPYVREVLAAFECPLSSVRLLRLGARSSIHEHRDYRLGQAHGEVRIHVPIVTNDQVAFFLDGERVRMGEGEAWYLDLDRPHRVDNESDTDRVHLVIDCVTNDWLDRLLATGPGVTAPVPEVAAAPAPPRQWPSGEPAFADALTAAIAAFLREIGLVVVAGPVPDLTPLPGISIEQGALVVDEVRLRYPGDLLHEAGHLAVVEPSRRATMTRDAGADPAAEMMAISWSYAAALHMGLDPSVVFHADGYRGGSASLLENFAQGRYLAVPMLQWLGLTYDEEQARRHGAEPYPAMRHWLYTNHGPAHSA